MENNNAKGGLSEFEIFLQRLDQKSFVLTFQLRKKALIGSVMLIWQLVVVDFVSCLSRV